MQKLIKINSYKFFEKTFKKKQVPLVFIEVAGKGQKPIQIKIKLNEHIVPETSENFVKLAQGFTHEGKNVSLKGKKFVNNIPGTLLELEEIPQTIFGQGMLNENYQQKFNKKGLVAMSRTTKEVEEKSSSGFFITFKPLDVLDKYVVVGEVVEGLKDLQAFAEQDSQLQITNSGKLGNIDL